MNNKLFVYGTLQESEVQIKVIGRIVDSFKDTLLGFKMSTIIINNNTYPIIIKEPKSDEKINGLVLEINTKDLIKLDEYETNAYQRKRVNLQSGVTAWVYQK